DQLGHRMFMSSNNAAFGPIGHELGHNLGLYHANSIACVDGQGNPVALSATCTEQIQGDSYDVMGPAAPRFTAFHREQMGWLQPDNIAYATVSGDYTLAPIEQPSAGVQSLHIPRPSDPRTDFHLDFRQPFGLDNYFPNDPAIIGVMIRI